MEEVKVSSKGQIVIPKHLREELGIGSGRTTIINKVGKELRLAPKPKDPLKALIELGREMKLGDMRKEIKEARKEAKRDALFR